MPRTIAIIGAGSITFTRRLIHDVLSVDELQDTVFAMTDVNKKYLDMAAQLLRRDVRANRLSAKILATTNRQEALADADHVLNLTRIGGLEAFEFDIDIPLKYGVDQCVGDTLCIGGVMYGQRSIPPALDFCKDIREVSKPDAILFNYSNPNAMITWAANEYGNVRTIGLCHGVQGGHEQIAQVIRLLVNGKLKPGMKGYRRISTRDVDIVCAGINHQTWYIRVVYDGEDWTGRLLEGFEKHPVYRKTEKVRIDLLRRFGYFTTESNGHVSEYLPWYRKRPREIRKWISLDSWINGETGGYLREYREKRDEFDTHFPELMKADPPTIGPENRTLEHFSYILEALESGRIYRGHFNVPNNGCITNLPADAIVEVPGYVDRDGICIPRVGDLPIGCAAICNASIGVQRLAVEAAAHGDAGLLKQAVMLDPLTGAVCNTYEISQMVDEMLVAQAKWLPQYSQEIQRARKRLHSEKPLGTRRTKGAARRKPIRK